jgi:uncharacterized repeat protein (TIGR02543 family)
MAISPNNTPVVAYTDSNAGNKVEVKEYNGTSWVNLGGDGISAGSASYVELAISSDDTPYVAYADGTNGDRLTVLKWNGTTWTPVGGAASGSSVIDVSFTTGPNGTLYTSFRDSANGNKATVMKWDGSNWAPVGTAGLSTGEASFTSVAIDSNGIPYVSYQDATSGNKATVMKFNGTNWVPVGIGQISTGIGNYSSMKLTTNNNPIVAYRDGDQSYSESVGSFDGTNWNTVGSLGFSNGQADYGSLALGSNNTPYVVYTDGGVGGNATVMAYNGSSWVPVGTKGFSAGSVLYPSLVLDKYSALYVAYVDSGTAGKAVVMKYTPTYTLSFDSQGGSAVNSISNQVGGVTITLPAAPTRSGYSFVGWNTASNGSGTSYGANASYTLPGSNTTLYATWQSGDNDGVPAAVEDAAPNNGDGNNDGIPDSQQSNVASFINPITGSYAAVAVDSSCALSSVDIKQSSTLGSDTSYNYPLGLLNFTTNCGTPGFATTVKEYYYNPPTNNFIFRKYMDGAFKTVPGATLTTAIMGGEQVLVASYQVSDGGVLDSDGTVNGVIVDPAGPAVAASAGSLTNTGIQLWHTAITAAILAAGAAITILLPHKHRKLG